MASDPIGLWDRMAAGGLGCVGTCGLKGQFWALVSDWAPGAGAAAAIAQINALSDLTGSGASYHEGSLRWHRNTGC